MIHKKRKKNAIFGFDSHIQGRFRPFPACSGHFSAYFSCIGYRPIWPDMAHTAWFWPNQPGSARIEADSARIEPHRHESSRVGVNPIKKKKKKTQTRSDTRATTSDAVSLVGHSCDTSGAASVLSRQGFIREVNLLGIWYTELEFMKINPSIFLYLIWIQMLRQP